jgi:prepilin-type processing-associated H-X9-DG protein
MSAKSAVVSTNDGGAALAFKCPSDVGYVQGQGIWPPFRGYQPTTFDALGSSYTYNALGNNDFALDGLHGKKASQVTFPAKCILITDRSAIAEFDGLIVPPYFEQLYWHDRKRICYANVAFVDGHVKYFATVAVPSKSTYQMSPDWSFIYNQ